MTRSIRRRPSGLAVALAAAVMLVAAGLRAWDWPRRYDVRDVDEVGYLSSSLCLVEGLSPGYKPAPAGPLIWLGWAWAQGHVLYDAAHPTAAERAAPVGVRAFLVMDRALFDLYHDLSGMRQFIVAVSVGLSLLAVGAGFAYGWRVGGTSGAVLLSGLLAACPLFVDFADQCRPYSMAWSFGVLAVWAAGKPVRLGAIVPGRRRIWIVAGLMGLSVGSRVEMVLLLPLLWWEWSRWPTRGRRRWGGMLLLATAPLVVAYGVAPWLLTGLPGNLRAIATIQLMNPVAGATSVASTLKAFAYGEGFGPVLCLFVVGAGLRLRHREPGGRARDAVLVGIVGLLVLTVFKSTGFGLHHKGPALVALVLGSATVAGRSGAWPRARWAAVALCVALPLARAGRRCGRRRVGRRSQRPTGSTRTCRPGRRSTRTSTR